MEAVSTAMVTGTDRVPMDKVATDRQASAREAMVSALWVQALCSRGQVVGTVVVHIRAAWARFIKEHLYVSK